MNLTSRSSDTIRYLQTKLVDLCFPIIATGKLDAVTRQCVQVMQCARDLPVTGAVDASTLRAVDEAVLLKKQYGSTSKNLARIAVTSKNANSEIATGLYCHDTFGGAVAFTFDDGPSPRYTPFVVDILNRSGVVGTFYMVGAHVASWTETALLVARGHLVGNHTWSHPNLLDLEDDEVLYELQKTFNALKNCGIPCGSRVYRPPFGIPFFTSAAPYGEQWERHGHILECASINLMMWQIDSKDWSFVGNPEAIVERVSKQITNGNAGVILLHDVHAQTVIALPGILDIVRRHGLEIVTDIDLLKAKYQGRELN